MFQKSNKVAFNHQLQVRIKFNLLHFAYNCFRENAIQFEPTADD